MRSLLGLFDTAPGQEVSLAFWKGWGDILGRTRRLEDSVGVVERLRKRVVAVIAAARVRGFVDGHKWQSLRLDVADLQSWILFRQCCPGLLGVLKVEEASH